MSKQLIIGAALIAALAAPRAVGAHEGHAHKMMGTVAARHDNQLDVKSVDGKTSTITLDEKTQILRGKAKVTVQDITPGERVVVTAMEKKGPDGKSVMLASEVRLGETSRPTSQ
jgi:hypothetical protein